MARKPNKRYHAREGYWPFTYGGSFQVFWNEHTDLGEPGWYWAAGFPGCMHDGDPSGPFTSSTAAFNDAKQ